MKRFLGLFFALISLPGVASAACSGLTCADVQITYLYTSAANVSVISTSGTESSLSCTAAGNLITIPTVGTSVNWLYANILTAYYNHSIVNVRVVADGSGNCEIGYITTGTP